MFKIISAVFTTGFATGAASALLAVHRGHIELPPTQPDTGDAENDDAVNNGSSQESDAPASVTADAGPNS